MSDPCRAVSDDRVETNNVLSERFIHQKDPFQTTNMQMFCKRITVSVLRSAQRVQRVWWIRFETALKLEIAVSRSICEIIQLEVRWLNAGVMRSTSGHREISCEYLAHTFLQ